MVVLGVVVELVVAVVVVLDDVVVLAATVVVTAAAVVNVWVTFVVSAVEGTVGAIVVPAFESLSCVSLVTFTSPCCGECTRKNASTAGCKNTK